MMNGKANPVKTPPQRFYAGALVCLVVCLLILVGKLNPALGGKNKLFLGFRHGKDPDSIPKGWELLTYHRTAKNEMSLITEEKRTVLRVKSLGSTSALLKRLDVDIRKFPILVWAWKIDRVVGMAIENQIDRNDSAARIRVIFGKEREKPQPIPPKMEEFLKSLGIQRAATEPSGYKIDYIWGNRVAKGKAFDYPGSRNHMIVVMETGNTWANRWVWEQRNLLEDYRQFFHRDPPGLSGIVVLTDTEQTNEGVEAWYSSVVLMSQ